MVQFPLSAAFSAVKAENKTCIYNYFVLKICKNKKTVGRGQNALCFFCFMAKDGKLRDYNNYLYFADINKIVDKK